MLKFLINLRNTLEINFNGYIIKSELGDKKFMESIEIEYKCLIEEKIYDKILEFYHNEKIKKYIQINYYFDTPDFSFFSNNTTLRVRQKENQLLIQYKYGKSTEKSIRTSKEYVLETEKFPLTIRLDNKLANLLGNLITERIEINYCGAKLCLDKNFYLGSIDFELEIETADKVVINKIVEELKLEEIPIRGKYSRFIDKYRSLGGTEIIR